MIRRCHTPLVVLTALFGLAGSVQASGLATYQLENTSADGSAPITQVVASILPAGSVPDGTNPSETANPFSVLAGSTGFNVANLVDYLGSGTLSTGDPVEVIKLQFDSQGLAAGGVVNFSLALDSSYSGPPPTLVLAPGTTGLSLQAYTPPATTTTSGNSSTSSSSGSGSSTTTTSTPPTTTVTTPEPISLALWSAAAGLGLLRARAFRRAQLKNL